MPRHVAPFFAPVFAPVFTLALLFSLALAPLVGCSSYRASAHDDPSRQADLAVASAAAQQDFLDRDPTLQAFFDSAHGYAIFPEVTKGAAGIGAAHGQGEVYEQDTLVGHASVSQGSLGAQLGGQVYSQIVFFEDEATMRHFKRGNLEFAAQASAVAASAGAGANADYADGVAVFTTAARGLMFEASIGGQKFAFRPLK
ncbi:MAG: YSC84-related protein [Planctomycetota bacterium]